MDGISALQRMAEHNLQELRFDLPVSLRLQRPVIADSRMQPHEWLLTPAGQVLKTDSGSHGDDHFFPGPTDIAWTWPVLSSSGACRAPKQTSF